MNASWSLPDRFDATEVQSALASLHDATGMPACVLWQHESPCAAVASTPTTLCMEFQFTPPCLALKDNLWTDLLSSAYVEYACAHELHHVALPIRLQSRMCAALHLGPFLYDDDIPKPHALLERAEALGIDANAFVKAWATVPVFSHQVVQKTILLHSAVARLVAFALYQPGRPEIRPIEPPPHTLGRVGRAGGVDLAFLDAVPSPAYIKNAQGLYTACNRPFEDLTGCSQPELLGRSDHSASPGSLSASWQLADQSLLVEGGVQSREFEIQHCDGHVCRAVRHAATFLTPDGSLEGMVGILAPCDNNNCVNGALRQNAVIQGSPIPQFVLDQDHKILCWNRALEEYSGVRADSVIGTRQQWRAFYSCERPCLADLLIDEDMDGVARWYGNKFSK